MPTLTLPQLVAGRDLAVAAVRRLGSVKAADVVVDARPLVSGTASFAAELVRSVLVEGAAARLIVIGGPPEFLADANTAAVDLAVTDRVTFAASEAELHLAS